jgi:hypothetical protein
MRGKGERDQNTVRVTDAPPLSSCTSPAVLGSTGSRRAHARWVLGCRGIDLNAQRSSRCFEPAGTTEHRSFCTTSSFTRLLRSPCSGLPPGRPCGRRWHLLFHFFFGLPCRLYIEGMDRVIGPFPSNPSGPFWDLAGPFSFIIERISPSRYHSR